MRIRRDAVDSINKLARFQFTGNEQIVGAGDPLEVPGCITLVRALERLGLGRCVANVAGDENLARIAVEPNRYCE